MAIATIRTAAGVMQPFLRHLGHHAQTLPDRFSHCKAILSDCMINELHGNHTKNGSTLSYAPRCKNADSQLEF
jgi:hypothetical protein